MKDDLIKRSDAIEAITYSHLDNLTREERIAHINALPSADRPQGEWIDRSDGGRILNPWWENYECNRCGYYGSGTWNFCPSCGCRMKGTDDE